MKLAPALLVGVATLVAACGPGPMGRPGPVVNAQPNKVGGTIAGIVKTADNAVAVPGRKVTAIDQTSGARFEATTGSDGGYTIKVPTGRYQLEVELHSGETLAKRPDPTRVNRGDLDPDRNFVLAVAR